MNKLIDKGATELCEPIADTDLQLPALGLGCGTLGDPDQITTEEQAQETLRAAWNSGIRYFDTAPWYGNTQSEHRLGYFLRQQPRHEFVLSSKVGRVYSSPDDRESHADSAYMKRWKGGLAFQLRFDYSRDGILRSYEDSMTRMGLNRIDALTIHDLDPRHRLNKQGVMDGLKQLDAGGGYAVLADLKARGEIRAIGAGINHIGMIPEFVERFELDYFLVAMPYTLLDQPALDEEFALLEDHNISVIIGAVFASGVLATGATENAQYGYQPLQSDTMDRVQEIETVCARHDVPLHAAALQFPLAHPLVTTVIPGANHADQISANVSGINTKIPTAFWAELQERELLRADAPCPSCV